MRALAWIGRDFATVWTEHLHAPDLHALGACRLRNATVVLIGHGVLAAHRIIHPILYDRPMLGARLCTQLRAQPGLAARASVALRLVLLGTCAINIVFACAGCAGRTSSVRSGQDADAKGSSPSADRAAALVDGVEVSWQELLVVLSEMSGAAALDEIVLDKAVATAFATAGHTLTQDMVDRERRLAVDSLRASGQAGVSLDDLRASRGLGPARFDRVLRRTAMLRAMVHERVEVTDSMVSDRFEIVYGPTVSFRVITTSNHAAIAALRSSLLSVQRRGVDAEVEFARAAMQMSSDTTAMRGGMVERVSPKDPAYPEVVRVAVQTLGVGAISDVLALEESQCAMVYITEKHEASATTFGKVRDDIVLELTLRQERIHMESLVGQLTERAVVQPLDGSLAWSWRASRSER